MCGPATLPAVRVAAGHRPRYRDRAHLPARPQYADAFGLDALGADGRPIRITMGSYGVGISRAVAAIAEQTHDELGLSWPASIAPFDVHLVATGKDGEIFERAERIATELDRRVFGSVRRPPGSRR
jgi:prolyl-tRNA synthetase